MQTIVPSQLKRGMVIILDDTPHMVEEVQVTGSGQAKHRVHARIRHLVTERHCDQGFLDNDHLTIAELEYRQVLFSYPDADQYVFMQDETYEEHRLTAEQIGERHWFLKENEEYKGTFLEGRIVDVELPDHFALEVTETAAPQRAAQQSASKKAKLEGGLEITVPLFIASGDKVKVDTKTHKYAGKE